MNWEREGRKLCAINWRASNWLKSLPEFSWPLVWSSFFTSCFFWFYCFHLLFNSFLKDFHSTAREIVDIVPCLWRNASRFWSILRHWVEFVTKEELRWNDRTVSCDGNRKSQTTETPRTFLRGTFEIRVDFPLLFSEMFFLQELLCLLAFKGRLQIEIEWAGRID